jgi:peroxiredoxin
MRIRRTATHSLTKPSPTVNLRVVEPASQNGIAMSRANFITAPSTFNPLIKHARMVVLSLVGVAGMFPVPAAAQKDVHAPLVVQDNRKAAPNFHLDSAEGRVLEIADFKGKVVLLNFWATACGGCVLEIPSFIDLQRKYEGRDFTAVGISADIPYEGLKSPEEAWQKVRPFVAEHQVNYPIVMGSDAVIDAYGFKSYPATYLIDKSGHIAATYVGVVSKDDVDANIQRLLAER